MIYTAMRTSSAYPYPYTCTYPFKGTCTFTFRGTEQATAKDAGGVAP